MNDLIITGGNVDHFTYLQLFVSSLRANGRFSGTIALCDNLIEGTWDKPGRFLEGGSFTAEQLRFFKDHEVAVFEYSELLASNDIPRESIDCIPSQTQRFPHKFIYTTLISKKYLKTARNICFFDADVYFQKPIQPLFDQFREDGIFIVGERLKIGQSPFLAKWIAYSDFSILSDQELYLQTMNNSLDYCSGFFGGNARRFHALVLLSTLLLTNQWVRFYSDQPTLNILKSFFHYPFIEISKEYVFHLGEFHKEDFVIRDATLSYKGMDSIAIHFNGPNKDTFEAISRQYSGLEPGITVGSSFLEKVLVKGVRALRSVKKMFR